MSNFVLSEDARKHIHFILERTNAIEREHIDDAVSHIDASLSNAGILEKFDNPKESATELAALHKSIVRLRGKIRALSPDSKLALDHYFNEGDGKQTVAHKIAGPRPQRGSGFAKLKTHAKFQIYAEAMEKAASKALSEINVPRGPPVNFKARSIALHLRESLEDFGVKTTTIDDGPFMAILDVALSEMLPTKENSSYNRHGRWAISVKGKSEVNWTSMKADTQK